MQKYLAIYIPTAIYTSILDLNICYIIYLLLAVLSRVVTLHS